MASALDEIRTPGASRGKCNYCDEQATSYIEVRVREKKDRKQITSRTVSGCDAHTVELFKDIEKLMEKRR